jgi:hypothetical protein
LKRWVFEQIEQVIFRLKKFEVLMKGSKTMAPEFSLVVPDKTTYFTLGGASSVCYWGGCVIWRYTEDLQNST